MGGDDEDPPAGAARVTNATAKGFFELPENATDLIDLFLDADIRQARAEIHTQIEQQNATPAATVVQKAVVDIHAITEQGKRDRLERRAKNGR